MAKHVQGSAIANATSYKLFERISGDYTELATQDSGGAIDFDLSLIRFRAGNHTLTVKAFGEGYNPSEYSNEVVYEAPLGYYTITYKYMYNGVELVAQTTETVVEGTVKTFVAGGMPAVEGYSVDSIVPESVEVYDDTVVTINYKPLAQAGYYLSFDFDEKTLEDYVTEGVITIPATSSTAELVYTERGMETTATSIGTCLLNGVQLTNPMNVGQNWAVEVTMTMDPYQEDFGNGGEALYPNFIFFSTTEEEGHTHGTNCLAPAVYMNAANFAGRISTNNGTTVGSNNKPFVADGVEHTYKYEWHQDTLSGSIYKDGVKTQDFRWTSNSVVPDGKFGYALNAHKGYSSAKNFTIKKGYAIRKLKLYTIE